MYLPISCIETFANNCTRMVNFMLLMLGNCCGKFITVTKSGLLFSETRVVCYLLPKKDTK